MPAVNSRLPGLYKLDPAERTSRIAEASGRADGLGALQTDDADLLRLADNMVENAIGVMPVPLGVAANFTIDGIDRLIPMATEESSVIAAASHAAAIARDAGGFWTSSSGSLMIAQIQLIDVPDPHGGRMRLLEARDELLELAAAQDPVLCDLGAGPRDIEVRVVGDDPPILVIHLLVDVGDAMGANAVNTMAEAISGTAASIGGGKALLRILSNKADRRLVRSRAIFPAARLGGLEVVDSIVAATQLAIDDPYRAATHNKGIMNGVSAVVLATGNDTRAVEAGAHSHAVRDGRYTSLSRFEADADGNLVGSLELPMPVGLVGGATRVHPVANGAVDLLGVKTARDLAAVIVSVGLAQNLAAVKALATEGIQRGHMALHARNLAIAVGAETGEIDILVQRLIESGRIRHADAESVLAELRSSGATASSDL